MGNKEIEDIKLANEIAEEVGAEYTRYIRRAAIAGFVFGYALSLIISSIW